MQNDNVDNSGFTFLSLPLKQIPVNEYRSLRERKFFRWATLKRWKYTTKLLAVWVTGFLFSTLIFATKSSQNLVPSDYLGSIVIANIFVLLCLVKLYVAWHHIYTRLLINKIDYQILKPQKTVVWQKPKLMQYRDGLVARFQIRPVLQRLQRTITSIFIALILALLFLIDNS